MNKLLTSFLFCHFIMLTLNAQYTISGQINCLDGMPMAGQEVMLIDNTTDTMTVNTDADGYYQFPDLTAGEDYAIAIEKNGNPLNGVTTYDLVLIWKHVIQVQPFPTPYHYLIADVNGSGSVSTFDLIVMRQLILSIIQEFPTGKTWQFATEDFNYNPPMGSVNNVSVTNLQDDEVINFVAVKMGDVSGGSCN